MRHWQKVVGLSLVMALLSGVLVGCSGNQDAPTSATSTQETEAATAMPTANISSSTVAASNPSDAANATATPVPLTSKQRNSISMLNHLVVFTQEVNNSKNSRLFLEEAYSSLYNNTHPNVVDARTQVEINFLFDTIESYRMIAAKRERLQYIYEQNRAQALRNAVPNPLGLIATIRSFDIASLIASVVYMAVDSVASYQSSTSQADMQYLQDGWELDDEQATTLHNMRKGTFNYMVETVRDYDLPGELALTEEAVADYVEWKGYSNNLQKIQLFEAHADIYQAFGPYWLTLAQCYYNNGDYAKCLEAIHRYEALDLQIFRRDFDYANALPLAIIAAEKVLSETEYITTANDYAEAIVANTGNNEWALRYFAAQTHIALYGKTGDSAHLSAAYDIALNNVSYLLTEQKKLNATYIADVQQTQAPEGATDAQKKDAEQYNKLLVEERKTALPPVYEPLLLNCDLLSALFKQLNIAQEEAIRVNGILHENGNSLFLAQPIDGLYWFNEAPVIDAATVATTYKNAEFTLPAQYVSENSAISVVISQNGETTVIDDWKIANVERESGADISTFTARYTSEAAKSFKYTADADIEISVTCADAASATPLVFHYKTIPAKMLLVIDTVDFQRVDE